MSSEDVREPFVQGHLSFLSDGRGFQHFEFVLRPCQYVVPDTTDIYVECPGPGHMDSGKIPSRQHTEHSCP